MLNNPIFLSGSRQQCYIYNRKINTSNHIVIALQVRIRTIRVCRQRTVPEQQLQRAHCLARLMSLPYTDLWLEYVYRTLYKRVLACSCIHAYKYDES
jgi:hypothetical protein